MQSFAFFDASCPANSVTALKAFLESLLWVIFTCLFAIYIHFYIPHCVYWRQRADERLDNPPLS